MSTKQQVEQSAAIDDDAVNKEQPTALSDAQLAGAVGAGVSGASRGQLSTATRTVSQTTNQDKLPERPFQQQAPAAPRQ